MSDLQIFHKFHKTVLGLDVTQTILLQESDFYHSHIIDVVDICCFASYKTFICE